MNGAASPAGADQLPLAVVLDTNVCLDLFLFADPVVQGLTEQLRQQLFCAHYSEQTREEWRRVLDYRVWKLDHSRQTALQAAFDGLLHAHSISDIPPAGSPLPQCRDPDDQKFLQLALALSPSVLITKDRDLLKLARVCRRRHAIAIVTPSSWNDLDTSAMGALYTELRQRRDAIEKPGF